MALGNHLLSAGYSLVTDQQNKFRLIRLVSCIVCYATLGHAQAVDFDAGSRKEVLYDKTPVSGEIKVGLMFQHTNQIVTSNTFYAKLPKEKLDGKKLCTIISSNDGLYKGELSHTLKTSHEGKTVEFKWESIYSDKLKKYHRNEFAILSGIASRCDKAIENFVVVDWTTNHSNEINFIVNSDKKPRVSIAGKTKQIFECDAIQGNQNVTFNYRCKVPLSAITADSKIYIQQKVKKLNTFTMNEYAFPVSY